MGKDLRIGDLRIGKMHEMKCRDEQSTVKQATQWIWDPGATGFGPVDLGANRESSGMDEQVVRWLGQLSVEQRKEILRAYEWVTVERWLWMACVMGLGAALLVVVGRG